MAGEIPDGWFLRTETASDGAVTIRVVFYQGSACLEDRVYHVSPADGTLARVWTWNWGAFEVRLATAVDRAKRRAYELNHRWLTSRRLVQRIDRGLPVLGEVNVD